MKAKEINDCCYHNGGCPAWSDLYNGNCILSDDDFNSCRKDGYRFYSKEKMDDIKKLIKEIGNIYSKKIKDASQTTMKVIAFDIIDEISLETAERRIIEGIRKRKEEMDI